MYPTEKLQTEAEIEIEGVLEAVLTDLRRRFDAGELQTLEFRATDSNRNTLHGSVER